MFRSKDELDYEHRDSVRQQELLRVAFAGMHPQVAGWLAEMDRTPAFYFDSITQLRLDIWSRRRVPLVGDAGYCPGPAVGGSTSLAAMTDNNGNLKKQEHWIPNASGAVTGTTRPLTQQQQAQVNAQTGDAVTATTPPAQ